MTKTYKKRKVVKKGKRSKTVRRKKVRGGEDGEDNNSKIIENSDYEYLRNKYNRTYLGRIFRDPYAETNRIKNIPAFDEILMNTKKYYKDKDYINIYEEIEIKMNDKEGNIFKNTEEGKTIFDLYEEPENKELIEDTVKPKVYKKFFKFF